MRIESIGVVGAGTMGNGIAQVCAVSGFKVIMQDIADEPLQRGLATIEKSLNRLLAKDRITSEQKDAALNRIRTTTTAESFAEVNVVIEAATENLDLKLKIFQELDAVCNPEIILASNTSSISITKIAGQLQRADRVIGMHFMNPVPMMQLVEIIRALQTSDETHRAIVALTEKLDKTPVTVKDSFGFVANRILLPMINEAAYCLHEGLATREHIDTVMKLGMNHPMGPIDTG